MDCFKCAFLFLNALYAVLALCFIGVGSNFLASEEVLEHRFLSIPIILILTGVCVLVIAAVGTWGACKANPCLLKTFGTVMGVVFIIQISLEIFIMSFYGQIYGFMNEHLSQSMQQYNVSKDATDVWNVVQHGLHCCGMEGYQDWENTTFGMGSRVPDSCCMLEIVDCGANSTDIYREGCFKLISDGFQGIANVFTGIAIIIGIVQLFGICLSCVLAAKSPMNAYQTIY